MTSTRPLRRHVGERGRLSGKRRTATGTYEPPAAQLTASAGRPPVPPDISGVPFSATDPDLSTWRRTRQCPGRTGRPPWHRTMTVGGGSLHPG